MRKDFFVPGRTELAGNHTDHQHGNKGIAAGEIHKIFDLFRRIL